MRARILANIIGKEWRNTFTKKSYLVFILVLPIILTGQSFWLVYSMTLEEDPGEALPIPLEGLTVNLEAAVELTPLERMPVFVFLQVPIFLLLVPVLVSNVLATYSIVEEKQTRTLEPLLATPVTTRELLFGKTLSGAIPAVAIYWLCSGLLFLLLSLIGPRSVIPFMLEPLWLVSWLLLAPLIAILAYLLGVLASSRASEPKEAQALALVIILPLLGLVALQVLGIVLFNLVNALLLAGGLALVSWLVLLLAVRSFQREQILVRWK